MGCLWENHPVLGMLGMHGTAYANFSVSECDLLICGVPDLMRSQASWMSLLPALKLSTSILTQLRWEKPYTRVPIVDVRKVLIDLLRRCQEG